MTWPIFCFENMHQQWLQRALTLAKEREGLCAPNPSVGAVIVKNNQVVAEGFHLATGFPHAEIEALNQLGDQARGADLYVTLEPCCHYGRTPPCTDRIKKEGIKAVYFGYLDPNPLVSGQGQENLISAGIICEHIQLPEIDVFYQPYSYWIQHRMPWVTAKLAVTADGYIATIDRKPIVITGKECQQLTHNYRLHSDAILSTVQTIISDDPQLNVRLSNTVIEKPVYLLDTHCQLPLNAKIIDTAQSLTIFHDVNADVFALQRLTDFGVRCIPIDLRFNQLNLHMVLKQIAEDGMHTIWIEAGGTCFSAFFNQKLLHRAILYQSEHLLETPGLMSPINLSVLKQSAKSIQESQLEQDNVFIFEF